MEQLYPSHHASNQPKKKTQGLRNPSLSYKQEPGLYGHPIGLRDVIQLR